MPSWKVFDNWLKEGEEVGKMWWVFGIANALTMSAAGVFIKLSTSKISESLGAFLAQASSAFLLFLFLILASKNFSWTRLGIGHSFVAGIGLALGLLFFFRMFAAGAPLSLAALVTQMSVLVFNILFGLVLFKESLSLRAGLGLVLGMLSIWLAAGSY